MTATTAQTTHRQILSAPNGMKGRSEGAIIQRRSRSMD